MSGRPLRVRDDMRPYRVRAPGHKSGPVEAWSGYPLQFAGQHRFGGIAPQRSGGRAAAPRSSRAAKVEPRPPGHHVNDSVLLPPGWARRMASSSGRSRHRSSAASSGRAALVPRRQTARCQLVSPSCSVPAPGALTPTPPPLATARASCSSHTAVRSTRLASCRWAWATSATVRCARSTGTTRCCGRSARPGSPGGAATVSTPTYAAGPGPAHTPRPETHSARTPPAPTGLAPSDDRRERSTRRSAQESAPTRFIKMTAYDTAGPGGVLRLHGRMTCDRELVNGMLPLALRNRSSPWARRTLPPFWRQTQPIGTGGGGAAHE